MVDIKLSVTGRLTQKHNIFKQTTRNTVYFCSSLFLLFLNNVAMLPLLGVNNLQTAKDPAGGSRLAC